MFFEFLSLLFGSPGRLGVFAPGWSRHRWLHKPSLSEEPPRTAALSLGQCDCTHQQHSCHGPICFPAQALRPITLQAPADPQDLGVQLWPWLLEQSPGWSITIWASGPYVSKFEPCDAAAFPDLLSSLILGSDLLYTRDPRYPLNIMYS